MARKFQLAIQGGGARLADLLVALEAIEDFNRGKADSEQVQMTRIAGTSAGAIAAVIFAAGPGSVAKARDYLERRAPVAARAIIPTRWYQKILGFGSLIWGSAACREDRVREELTSLLLHVLGKTDGSIQFSDLERPVFVIAANIRTQQQVTFYEPSSDVIEAVINSCAFPIMLRGARSVQVSPFVDGGLCSNLPADSLMEPVDVQEFGPVLALSFSSKPRITLPRNNLSFVESLFSTTVNNAVRRTKQSLTASHVLDIDTEIQTFDFAKAFDREERRANFKLIKLETDRWLQDNMEIDEELDGVPAVLPGNDAYEDLLKGLFDWYTSSIKQSPCIGLKNRLVVTAASLKDDAEDLIHKELWFAPIKEPLVGLKINIGPTERSVIFSKNHRISVRDPERKRVKVRLFPLLDRKGHSDDASDYQGHLVLFEPPLPPMSPQDIEKRGGYKVSFSTKVSNAFAPFRSEGSDYMLHANERSDDPGLEVELILLVPDGVQLEATTGGPECNEISGHELEDASGLTPLQFSPLGWRVKNLSAGQQMRINLKNTCSLGASCGAEGIV
ncbi:MAG: patatin-like phospholipase family protein [Hyphomicrobiaceae bacterium]